MGVTQWSGHDIISWSAGWMKMLTAAGAKSHRVTRGLSDHSRWTIPLRDDLAAE
jgi:hypothetical protein